MKQIITAIDFSENSINALKYTITFANIFNADVTMVWVDKPHSAYVIYPDTRSKNRQEAENRFKELIEKFSGKLYGKLDYKIREGKVYKEVVNQAKYNDANIIISGTHGISGFEEFWMGSNAYRIISATDIPVITLRKTFQVKEYLIRTIALPIDETLQSRQKVPFTARIASAMDSEVHIIPVLTSKSDSTINKVKTYCNQAKELLTKNQIRITEKKEMLDAESETIISYAEKINADLISIMTEQELNPLSYILGPIAQHVVNHSRIPVLTITPQDNFEFKAGLIH